jgi:hypothetical protein
MHAGLAIAIGHPQILLKTFASLKSFKVSMYLLMEEKYNPQILLKTFASLKP